MSRVGELWDKSLVDLLTEAVEGAVAASQLEPEEIEAVFVANKAGGGFNQQLHLNALASQIFAHFPPSMRVEGACASGGLAVLAAEQALLAGQYQTVLVVGVEKMTDAGTTQTTEVLAMAADYYQEYGSTFPGLYALLAQTHIEQFGTTRQQLSAVAQKNHSQALDNKKAQYRREFSLEQISNSNLVADPLRLLDCSPISDGAAAVVLTTGAGEASPKSKRTQIFGFGHGQDSLDLASRGSLTELGATVRAAQAAFRSAGLKPEEIEAAEVHDCFTIAEILAIEDLGFFEKGQGGPATLAGQTGWEGQVVVNPSGGLKAFGHPIGATGVKQIAYLDKLITEGKIETGLAHNVGGSGATAVVHILGRS
ncbi:MAG: thiolase domain-containing protein [Candidatus Pacebacteria bacterium]|nr:thiolase domain-containing protein [Candidatus Paceibacterota bacterium]